MSDDINVVATSRKVFGKGASRRLRRDELVPAVVYGDGKEPESIQLPHNEVLKHLDSDAFYSQLLMLGIDGAEPVRTILKDVQRHPYKQRILHMDFLRVTAGQELQVNVSLNFIGEEDAPGVKHGGIVSHNMNELAVACRPRDIPANIEVDMSALDIGDSVNLSDLKMPEGVRIVDFDPEDDATNHQIGAINAPRVEVEEDEDDAADGESSAVEGGEEPQATDTDDDASDS